MTTVESVYIPHEITPQEHLTTPVKITQKSLFYRVFRPFVKEVQIHGKLYHKLFSYIYTSDGVCFLGYYRPESPYDGIDYEFATDPDLLFCCFYSRN
jgi:hypothetical protein